MDGHDHHGEGWFGLGREIANSTFTVINGNRSIPMEMEMSTVLSPISRSVNAVARHSQSPCSSTNVIFNNPSYNSNLNQVQTSGTSMSMSMSMSMPPLLPAEGYNQNQNRSHGSSCGMSFEEEFHRTESLVQDADALSPVKVTTAQVCHGNEPTSSPNPPLTSGDPFSNEIKPNINISTQTNQANKKAKKVRFEFESLESTLNSSPDYEPNSNSKENKDGNQDPNNSLSKEPPQSGRRDSDLKKDDAAETSTDSSSSARKRKTMDTLDLDRVADLGQRSSSNSYSAAPNQSGAERRTSKRRHTDGEKDKKTPQFHGG